MDDARVQREADKVARQADAENKKSRKSPVGLRSDDHPYLIAKGVKPLVLIILNRRQISPWRASSPNVVLILCGYRWQPY